MSAGRGLRDVLTTVDHCHGIVVRDGHEDACGKPPVAIVDGRATEDEGYWPACAWHANRYGPCVPLADLLAVVEPRIRAEAWEEGRAAGAAEAVLAVAEPRIRAETLRWAANKVDARPTFPLPPSVISALLREYADAASTGEGDRG